MGRSQRHKVYIQGFASNDELYAQGQYAGMGDAKNPPEHMIPDAYKPAVTSVILDDVSTSTKTSVTVRGTGFYPGSVVAFDGREAPTEFFDDTKVRAVVQQQNPDPHNVSINVRNASLISNAMDVAVGGGPSPGAKPLPPDVTQTFSQNSPGPNVGDVVGHCAQPQWETDPGPFTYTIAADPWDLFVMAGSDIKLRNATPSQVRGAYFCSCTSTSPKGTSDQNAITFYFWDDVDP